MDIILIIFVAFLGCGIATAIAAAIPDAPIMLRALISVVGFMVGAVIAYVATWSKKNADQQAIRDAEIRYARRRPPQIVGSKCYKCQSSIMFIADAHLCENCNRVVCKSCQPSVPCSDCVTIIG